MSDARIKLLRLVKAPAAADSRTHLMATIHDDVIPRLILAHLAPSSGAQWEDSTRIPPREEEVAELARIASMGDLAGALSFIERLLGEGVSCESVLLNLVGPAARMLDDDWSSDERTFDDAMAGLETLEHVVSVLLDLINR